MREVIPTRVKLTASQAQNMIADIAVERNYTFYFWGHSEVALLASNANASFADEVPQLHAASKTTSHMVNTANQKLKACEGERGIG